MERATAIKGLRDLANFLEQFEDFPLPWDVQLRIQGDGEPILVSDLSMKRDDIAKLRTALHSITITKHFDLEYEGSFSLRANISKNCRYRAIFDRSKVCERKVVGKKLVPKQVIPELVIDEHEEEIVEWDCGSILAPVEATAVEESQ